MANATTENKKSFLHNDRMLVCGMLVFYGLCIIGLAGVAYGWKKAALLQPVLPQQPE